MLQKIKDTLFLGLILGFIAPFMGTIGFYLTKFSQKSFLEFIELTVSKNILSPLLSLCVVINLGVFYLFLNTGKYQIVRGILLSTFIYGLVIVIFKFAR